MIQSQAATLLFLLRMMPIYSVERVSGGTWLSSLALGPVGTHTSADTAKSCLKVFLGRRGSLLLFGVIVHLSSQNGRGCYAGSLKSKTKTDLRLISPIGHFLLTCLLLDSLVHSGKDGLCSRVVGISSSAHYDADARLQDLLSILQLKVRLLFLWIWKELVDVGCVKVSRSSPQQRLTMKIFMLDSGETPAICWASRTHALFNRVPSRL
ncbi:uncharacterized protein LOC122146209 [Cyprinus carpio]|uniref:Uncharacterized protein LOC122146209 n=1 Tax=Cyprinus carpio TaxID=7962 RepID=A0A9R0B3P3_CYPCA|nr:uncharacterized protein LOC122146209 [Cyprinus carpio]